MLIIRLVMVHMGPKHTQYGQKTARLAPVLQNGLNVHVGALNDGVVKICGLSAGSTCSP
jgi:hypothetical protein